MFINHLLFGNVSCFSSLQTLLSTYNKTIDVLAAMPSTAVYRTSSEQLTKQRMKLVEMVQY